VKVSKQRRNTKPRVSSPKGIAARQEARLKAFVPKVEKGGSGSYRCCKPGSGNPRKVGR
jgi:hypothetical protein